MPGEMVRCQEGHFYDTGKHSACPWCGVPSEIAGGARPGPPPTVPVAGNGVAGAGATRNLVGAASLPPVPGPPPLPIAGPAPGATRRYVGEAPEQPEFDPVVGWLVAIEGPDRGKDFRLRLGRNFVGRSSTMNVCIPGDDGISREKHAIVTFEPKKKTYWLSPGDSTGLTYLNGEVLHAPAELNQDDEIELGRTKLLFVPFLSAKHSW